MAKQFSSIKHPFLKLNCVPFIIFLSQSLEILCAWYLRLCSSIPISFFCHVGVFRDSQSIFYHFTKMGLCPFLSFFSRSILLVQQVHIRPSFGHIVLQHISYRLTYLKVIHTTAVSLALSWQYAWCKKSFSDPF